MPDPILSLLEPRWRGMLHLALVAAGAIVFLIVFFDGFDLSEGWAFLAGGMALFAIAGTRIHVQTLGRRSPVAGVVVSGYHIPCRLVRGQVPAYGQLRLACLRWEQISFKKHFV